MPQGEQMNKQIQARQTSFNIIIQGEEKSFLPQILKILQLLSKGNKGTKASATKDSG